MHTLPRFMVGENKKLRPGTKYVIDTYTWSVWQVGSPNLEVFNAGREKWFVLIKEMRDFYRSVENL